MSWNEGDVQLQATISALPGNTKGIRQLERLQLDNYCIQVLRSEFCTRLPDTKYSRFKIIS
jgi:hypothetical protein